ncbi:MAG: flagellar biosynthesis protein FlhF [Fibrobacteres bacterium]|nr:flagellar biosynthesis protein FlhF [Fibrobacterota bacterium]
MTIRKFKAATMKDALLLVKDELGPQAVILNTRKTGNALFGGERYEVTAGLDESAQKKAAPEYAMTYSPKKLKKNSEGRYIDSPVFGSDSATAVMERPMRESTVLPEFNSPAQSEFRSLTAGIDAMRSAVYSIADQAAEKSKESALPPALARISDALEQNEVSPAHVQQLIEQIKKGLPAESANDDVALRRRLFAAVESDMPVSGHIKKGLDRARRIALVGPTGVGKTTTIAKLAAHFRLRENLKVALIAADNYRMAAIEQIQQFAGISNIPLEIVYTDDEMKAALEKFSRFDMVFIDTAGRSQRNIEHMNDLRRTLLALDPDEVHLTVSVTTKMKDLRVIERKYSEIGYHRLIVTKLDETISYGTLYNLVKESGKAISYISTGQSIPDDLSLADSRSLANLIAGGGAA